MSENHPPAATPNANVNGNTNNSAPAPASGGAANQNNPQSSRGLPYYEKLRRELRDTLQKKRLMDKSMSQLEDQIYRFEQSYLEETTAGNIIKGFDNYIKGSSSGTGLSSATGLSLGLGSAGGASGGPTTRRKAPVLDDERVFSRSSASYLRDSPTPSSAQTTPSHANTPSSMYNGVGSGPGKPNGALDAGNGSGNVKGGGGSSKNKKKAPGSGNKEEDEEDKPPVKRLKITYSRDS